MGYGLNLSVANKKKAKRFTQMAMEIINAIGINTNRKIKCRKNDTKKKNRNESNGTGLTYTSIYCT